MCDISPEPLAETQQLCQGDGSASGARISAHAADVSDEAQVLRFRDAVLREHATDKVAPALQQRGHRRRRQPVRQQPRAVGAHLQHLLGRRLSLHARLPADAGEGGRGATSSTPAASTASGPRSGPSVPHTAYCAAKFAVKGFTEALMTDLKAQRAAHQMLGRDARPHRHVDRVQLAQDPARQQLRHDEPGGDRPGARAPVRHGGATCRRSRTPTSRCSRPSARGSSGRTRP